MKVVHFSIFAPHTCGLYHTAKDLVKAERGVGIDAHFVGVDSKDGKTVLQPAGQQDGWLTTSDVRVAEDADLLVRHTTIPNNLENSGIPIVLAIHGRPESSIILDEKGITPVLEGFHIKGQDCRYKAFFTFWPEHVAFWERIVPKEKLRLVPAMVDLMEWRPGGEKFDLGEFAGNPNILVADVWREDTTPFEEIMEVAQWIKDKCPTGKLHIAAAPTGKGAQVLWKALRDEGILGYAVGQTKDIKALYEACDVVVTPHKMATRIVREANAMGKKPINASRLGDWWKTFQNFPKRMQKAARKHAETRYRISNAGLVIKKMFEDVLTPKPKQRKILLDLGGHLGETVRRFYREVEDARHWEIHTFEPHPECFKTLKANLSRMKNVQCHEMALVGTESGTRTLYPGTVNSAEGSTILKGKTTGGIQYGKGHKINAQNITEFMVAIHAIPSDYIVLKMNIEGGEYGIMTSLSESNFVHWFDQIYIQTHKHKLTEVHSGLYGNTETKFRNLCTEKSVKLFMQEKGMPTFNVPADDVPTAEDVNWTMQGKLSRKEYVDYDEYLTEQKSKLPGMSSAFLAKYDEEYGKELHARLSELPYTWQGRTALCLGARQGTEVRVFDELGCFAVGIDLNPGPQTNHVYVLTGDFHNLPFPDAGVDYLFTNSLDHVYDIEKFLGEATRVMKPGGHFIVDAHMLRDRKKLSESGIGSDKWASLCWEKHEDWIAVFAECGLDLVKSVDVKDSKSSVEHQFCFCKKIPARIETEDQAPPEKVPEQGLKLAVIYDPECPKLTPSSYSQTYRDMIRAVYARFGRGGQAIRAVTQSCSAKDIEADVILIYDIHSSHHIEIDGLADHKAVKYTYFNDPHQQEFSGKYKDGPVVHKLGPRERTRRALSRGVDFIICPYTEEYWKYIAPYMMDRQQSEDMHFWFPPAPSIKRFPENLRTKPLSEREHKILGNGAVHGGGGSYDFRDWAFQHPNTHFIDHAMHRGDVPSGERYIDLLSNFAGALALCDTRIVPKYLEIPLAGCVCFAQDQEDYRRMGFVDGANCLFVDKQNFQERTQHFLRSNPSTIFRHIAEAGRKLIEENWTAECFADALYDHAKSKGA